MQASRWSRLPELLRCRTQPSRVYADVQPGRHRDPNYSYANAIAAKATMRMFSLEELEQAQRNVHAAFPGTPQYAWPMLSARTGTEGWVKHENHTPTGAFKVRGGLIYLNRLAATRPNSTGIIAATRGNH